MTKNCFRVFFLLANSVPFRFWNKGGTKWNRNQEIKLQDIFLVQIMIIYYIIYDNINSIYMLFTVRELNC